jgi:hypothetical protein
MFRHTLATLAYRGGKVLRGVNADFATFPNGEHGRTPVELLAHLAELMEWGLSIAKGNETWSKVKAKDWEHERERFFAALSAFDQFLASAEPMGCPPQRLFQAPIADALTHVGQLALLRRLAGIPIRGENYFLADIAVGRVGPEQSAPNFEF